MIENHTILCFASGYEAPPTSKHHVMHLLAERNTVLWVNYHASRMPSASGSDLKYIVRKLKQVCAGVKQQRKNLYTLTPMVLPLPASRTARQLNRWMLMRSIRAALKQLQSGPLQAWSFSPDVAYLLGRLGEQKVVYYCVDDFASFSGYDRQQVLRDEQQLCSRADLVVTTSLALQEAKQGWNKNTVLVPHGVDSEHFGKAVTEDLPKPADLEGISGPIFGFFGLIRDWVDLELIAEVARRRSEWNFVMIGDSTVELAGYRRLKNLHFLGAKKYQELPAYCQYFDVGLIPFKINELTLAVNPIKLREYLAAGLPVISSPLPEAELYRGMIHLAATAEEFIAEAEKALKENGPQQRQQRAAAMKQENWEGKVQEICSRLGETSS